MKVFLNLNNAYFTGARGLSLGKIAFFNIDRYSNERIFNFLKIKLLLKFRATLTLRPFLT